MRDLSNDQTTLVSDAFFFAPSPIISGPPYLLERLVIFLRVRLLKRTIEAWLSASHEIIHIPATDCTLLVLMYYDKPPRELQYIEYYK
jgi:hypothetical protein